MKSTRVECMRGIAMMLTLSSVASALMTLQEVNYGFQNIIYRGGYIALILVTAFLINNYLVNKKAPSSLFAALQFVFVIGIIIFFSQTTQMTPPKTAAIVIHAIMIGASILSAAYLAAFPATEKTAIACFDGSAIMLILTMFLDGYAELYTVNQTMALCLISLFASMIAMVTGRLSMQRKIPNHSGNAGAGKLVVVISLGLVALLAVLLGVAASGGTYRFSTLLIAGFKMLWLGICIVGRFLFGLLERLTEWLASLIKEEEIEAIEDVGMVTTPMDEVNTDSGATVPLWMIVILVTIAVLIVAYILFRLRKYRMSRESEPEEGREDAGTVVRSNGMWKAIKQLLVRAVEWVRYRINRFRYRKTIPVLALRCEKYAGRGMKRSESESISAYLRRAAAQQGSTELVEALHELADLAERCLYRGDWDTELPREMYQTICNRSLWKNDTE